ncbi:MAG TPA: prenyltransferase/squalene oxidase repeat-containing protein [Candidatus Dormibacteraeota bacterium]|nr:prenyltransferase/squalene oxidase repeat-containing protein [Candidatus Dormibacteraeota bacterium]
MRYDAIGQLLATGDPALAWAVGHDLFDEPLEPQTLWELPPVLQSLRRQREDGSWAYHGGVSRVRLNENYAQLATYQQMLTLISKYRLDRRHPAIPRATDFLLGFQTPEGDIRGLYGSQYTPNYTGDMLGLMIAAGYQEDRRVLRGVEWLISMRQDDGGWALPLRTVPAQPGGFTRVMRLNAPIQPDRSRPSSHLITGITLRALAAHPRYRHGAEARKAARLLAGRFLQRDRYLDRGARDYWTKLTFPFRWTDLASSLDAIALVGLPATDVEVAMGLDWLVSHQRATGLWQSGYGKTTDVLVNHWVTFAVARVLKRFIGIRTILEADRAPLELGAARRHRVRVAGA